MANTGKNPKKYAVYSTDSEKDFIIFLRIKLINLLKLKKSLSVILTMFILAMPVYSLTLKGSVEYTVDFARTVAFENTDLTIPKSEFNGVLLDIYYYSNIEAIKNGKLIAGIGFNRKLAPFYTKKGKLSFYGVVTEDQPNKKLYYDLRGHLIKYEINTFNGVYPYKTAAYNSKGQLLNINLIVSENESFVFDRNKKLIGHWIGDKCYNEKGEIDLTRRL